MRKPKRMPMGSCRFEVDACLHLIPRSGQSPAFPHQKSSYFQRAHILMDVLLVAIQ